jgi:galactoside O-acetyltransferase
MGFYSREQLEGFGFKSLGKDVHISDKTSIYSPGLISIGNHVRIDDFCILSGNITLGSSIHISAGVYLYGGKAGISLLDYSGVSSQCVVYAMSDDFSGNYMIGPMVNDSLRDVFESPVVISKYCQIGARSVILPGVVMETGAVVGSCSLVNKPLKEWSINFGNPAIFIRERSRRLLELRKAVTSTLEDMN